MGISYHHLKIVSPDKKTYRHNYLELDKLLTDVPEFVAKNGHLISIMKFSTKVFVIYFFIDEAERLAYISKNGKSKDEIFLIGSPDEHTATIHAIEEARQLDAGIAYDHIRKNEYSRRIYPLHQTDMFVMYYQQVGHMKYAMTDPFYDEFEQLKYYWKTADILKAATYVYYDEIDDDWVQEFQRDFVDTWEEGKSIFYHY